MNMWKLYKTKKIKYRQKIMMHMFYINLSTKVTSDKLPSCKTFTKFNDRLAIPLLAGAMSTS